MDERFHMDAFENRNAVCNMDEVFIHEWKWPSSMWLNFIDNSINVINFNELSFIHMVIGIHVI
jgi:hypothetical protein